MQTKITHNCLSCLLKFKCNEICSMRMDQDMLVRDLLVRGSMTTCPYCLGELVICQQSECSRQGPFCYKCKECNTMFHRDVTKSYTDLSAVCINFKCIRWKRNKSKSSKDKIGE